jgi:hypothetical protein
VKRLSNRALLALVGPGAAVAVVVVVLMGAAVALHGVLRLWEFLTQPKLATLVTVAGPSRAL